MGVVSRRLGLAALTVAAVLLPLRKSGEQSTAPPANARGLRLQELTQQLTAAQVRWTALAERDSALALLGRLEGRDSLPVIQLSGFAHHADGRKVEARVRSLWDRIGRTDQSIGTAVLIYNGANYVNQAWRTIYSGDLITERDGVMWCVAIVPGELRTDGSVLPLARNLDRALAPCVLLATFGRPGRGVGAWLDASRYSAARSNLWLGGSAELFDGNGGPPWGWLYDPTDGDPVASEGFSLIRAVGGLPFAYLLAPPYHHGAPGIRCLEGHAASCEESVLRSGNLRGPDWGVPLDLTTAGPTRVPGISLVTARPPAEFYLSDLIRDRGRDAFRTFWKSEQPFEQAFSTAFGESLGTWTARWARRQWDASWEARHGEASIVLGTNLSPTWPIVVLGWSLIALAAVAWAAKRRQVT